MWVSGASSFVLLCSRSGHPKNAPVPFWLTLTITNLVFLQAHGLLEEEILR